MVSRSVSNGRKPERIRAAASKSPACKARSSAIEARGAIDTEPDVKARRPNRRQCSIAGRSPMALFSLLKPGTHIQPHHGLINTRLICHIPLIAPADCALRVGAETRAWREGEALIFDDSIEHEAWNRSNRTRVILLFEIWRPELSIEERASLTALYEAIGAYGGVPAEEAL